MVGPMRRSAAAAGCAVLMALALPAGAVDPVMMSMVVKWGADLLSAASKNYSQKYSSEVEQLLVAMYANKTGPAAPGQQPMAGGTEQGQGYPQQQYGSAQYGTPPYAGPQPGGAQPGATPYPPQPGEAQYPQPAYGAGEPSIVLDADILAQRASDRGYRVDPVPIQDGDTLRDGGADPRRGDALKFSFRANCDCFVYVIGIDATGYVARIYPDAGAGHANPVRAHQQYVVPQGTSWYGLDEVKGVEQVFFIASRYPRSDIEGSLAQLGQTSRSSLTRSYTTVRSATLPSRSTRGLVKMQMGAPSAVQSESGRQHAFTPQAFGTQAGADEIVVARWFNHQ